MLVVYVPVNASRLTAGHAAVFLSEELTEVLVDRDQLSRRLDAPLSAVSTAIVAGLKPRNEPSATPWGRIQIVRHDLASSDSILPTITPAGIIVPVPHQLITADLARHIEDLGTETMRFYHPPSLLEGPLPHLPIGA